MPNTATDQHRVLVAGGTGKTGSRIVARLRAGGYPVRVGSRTTDIPFDWADPSTWTEAMAGVRVAYLAFQPDLAIAGAAEAIRAFAAAAGHAGVRKLVLLSNRGSAETVQCEQMVRESGLDWTILRGSFFAQNFSEGSLTEQILAGTVALPVNDVPEPFVDVDDIADVAVAALTTDEHNSEIYELTGPHAMTFTEAVAQIATATGRPIAFVPISRADFAAGLTAHGVPADMVNVLDHVFSTLLDGRNAEPMDGVRRALGREPKSFTDYVTRTAAAGVWNTSTQL
ncbi:NAD(P)H-binding protein [Nocardia sp. 004]|uniref:NmrA family NAD(P)-binding protein n=1 Tax=Nocardia sp. 004 TaxID=3385978 RepID=UPI0039A28F78